MSAFTRKKVKQTFRDGQSSAIGPCGNPAPRQELPLLEHTCAQSQEKARHTATKLVKPRTVHSVQTSHKLGSSRSETKKAVRKGGFPSFKRRATHSRQVVMPPTHTAVITDTITLSCWAHSLNQDCWRQGIPAQSNMDWRGLIWQEQHCICSIHCWSQENPPYLWQHNQQIRWGINVWCHILGTE